MPRAKFVKSVPVGNSFRVEKVKGLFDIEDLREVRKEFDVDIPIENKSWNIGLIVGSSGSGKTTIAKECFSDFYFFTGFDWDNRSIIENFPSQCSVNDITTAFNYAGLASAPDWLKPFSVLSNGQKMRAEIARLFVSENNKPVIYDEFTSVVDRQVAQVTSYAISKFIRRKNQQFVAVSCHRDIIEWLLPDWVYDTDANSFAWGCLRQRPEIKLCIRHAEEREWQLFKNHHYLSGSHNASAKKYIAEINRVPVAWLSVVHFPHPKVRDIKKVHRLVVRPDYQGLGIGMYLLNFISSQYKAKGFRMMITTGLSYFAKVLAKSAEWKCIRQNYVSRLSSSSRIVGLGKTLSTNRVTASFEFVG